ncbi:MAG: ABC transporter ATP-binding protein [Clostridia bacterium]|nr:ABC transporter ATP-binding protein [Clostridia bacterium]
MITASNLTKRFSDVTALDALSCHIPDGCVYGLVGANGAGKSTFLRLASGVYRPDGGSVCFDGEPVFDNPTVKRQLVFVPDELFLLPQSHMERMAKLYASAYERFSYKRFYTLVELFGLNPKKSFSTFSKGMRRQAACILALSTMAEYIFFDETFDGLDPVMRNLVKQTLYNDVVDRGVTAVVSSHSLRELEDTCDQLALLYKGGIVFESDVQNLKTSLLKIQVAFADDFDASRFKELNVVSFEKRGSVANLIVRGGREENRARVEALQPLLFELLPLTLEEVFIYEMEALGYVFEEPYAAKGRKQA